MVWHTTSPDGTISVRANTPNMQDNTTYTKTTMNNDHFWDIGVDEDGHHRQVQSPKLAADLVLSPGMDGGTYIKTVSADNTRIQGYYINAFGVYQYIPSFQTGTVSVTSTSSYVTVCGIEPHSYGLIYMFTDSDADDMQIGFFKSGATKVQTYNCTTQFSGSSDAKANLKFGNGAEASGLVIRARRQDGPSATYQWRVMYWGS